VGGGRGGGARQQAEYRGDGDISTVAGQESIWQGSLLLGLSGLGIQGRLICASDIQLRQACRADATNYGLPFLEPNLAASGMLLTPLPMHYSRAAIKGAVQKYRATQQDMPLVHCMLKHCRASGTLYFTTLHIHLTPVPTSCHTPHGS
jgi:hypothetical protein